MASIDLDDVSLDFHVRENKRMTLKEYILHGMFRSGGNRVKVVPALHDIQLHLRDGDRVGIIGHNGAGKSTMLKLIAGVFPPSKGRRTVQGRICSLFDMSLGFEWDACGWDNIHYRSYLQGETPKTLAPKLKEIAEFSELGEFLNMPVRFYSAGMLVRLAFSIATAAEPEILLVDEVLAVGDLAFQIKARERMRKMMENARILVVVSHELSSLNKICNQAVWMDHGTIHMVGPTDEVVKAYTKYMEKTPPKPGAALAA